MQNRQERRVRRLRLAAASENELRRGVNLIKDAFHVASLPGLAEGRLLIIRSLPIGQFSVDRSSAYLATVIERKLLELSSQAARADHPNAASYPAVYFLDEVEPYIVLAVRIARGDDTSAWFWPLAAKGWRPRMSRSDALRAILYRVAVAETGVIGIARLMRELLEHNLIDLLLSTLKTDDADQLMRTCGWPEAIPPAESSENQAAALDLEISGGALDTLNRWLKRWGATDARSKWLAGILLIEKKPGRLLDRQLLSRAVRLIEIANTGISKSTAISNRQQAARASQEYLGLGSGTNLSSSESSAPGTFDNLANTSSGFSSSTDAPSFESLPPGRFDNLANTSARELSPPASDSAEALRKSRERAGFPSSTNAPSFESPPPDLFEIAGVAGDLQSPELARTASRGNSPEAKQQSLASRWADDLIASPGAIDPLEASNLERHRTNPLLPGAAQRTEFGGFFFLLPVLSRLGIASFLETNPHLIELDFTAHLLRFLSAQLEIPSSDPVVASLPNPDESGPHMIEFSMPLVWRERLYKSGVLILERIKGAPGCRMLRDRSRRIVLSSWRGQTPQAVRELIGDCRIKRRTSCQSEDVTHALFNAWYRAIRRWCRAYAGLKLDELINRRALITSTRTHTDLFFDLRKVDIRVRRAGLDLDPAWVPWLGQVVSFHYLEEGEIDGL